MEDAETKTRVKNVDRAGVGVAVATPFDLLKTAQQEFVANYVENGGIIADAAYSISKFKNRDRDIDSKDYRVVVTTAQRWMRNQRIRDAIAWYVREHIMDPDTIRARISRIGRYANSEDVQLRATTQLAKMAGIAGESGGSGGGGMNITINLPGSPQPEPMAAQDVDFTVNP